MSFPDDYHVHTLQQLLDTCLLLQPGVEIDSILSLLVHRVSEHACACPESPPIADRSAFSMLLSTARECGIRCALACTLAQQSLRAQLILPSSPACGAPAQQPARPAPVAPTAPCTSCANCCTTRLGRAGGLSDAEAARRF
jgi:Vacuolar protein sorting-associated protein 35